MDNTKIYTAQEMIKVADCFRCGCGHDLLDGNMETIQFSKEDISAMLRYAAEMVERCEAIRKHFAMTKTESEMLNYILRGDAGKEEK